MPVSAVLSYAAAYCSLIVAATVLLRDKNSFVHRVFGLGMFFFALEEVVLGLAYGAVLPEDVVYWQKRAIALSTLLPGIWLTFSVTYARANWRRSLSSWKWILLTCGVVPVAF